MGLRNFFSNGEGPAARGEAQIVRACGVVVDHGNYGEKCVKAQGHDGNHMGSFVDAEDLQRAKEGRGGVDVVKQQHAPGSVMLIDDPRGVMSPAHLENPANALLAPVLTQLQAINDRFSRFESNVHQLNLVAGELVNKVLTPLKGELEQLRYNLGDKANSTVSMLERLVGHVDKQLDIALKLTGANAVHYRDEHGCHGDVPSIAELTESGVPEGEEREVLLIELECVKSENKRLRDENDRIKERYGEY